MIPPSISIAFPRSTWSQQRKLCLRFLLVPARSSENHTCTVSDHNESLLFLQRIPSEKPGEFLRRFLAALKSGRAMSQWLRRDCQIPKFKDPLVISASKPVTNRCLTEKVEVAQLLAWAVVEGAVVVAQPLMQRMSFEL